MTVAIITGSAGLIGAEAVRWFADHGLDVAGIDNDMRRFMAHYPVWTLTYDIPGMLQEIHDGLKARI